ncbi:MAG: Asp-tRNA(Asn)/Glu-tRNA(Gln) amidotransferase subunit GatA [Halobacteriales archaeon]|nr:Asp-tRNA(Asn)/Glu-tRNA(Gln) amidotransferase subunit GatA [Halobacteriales archaeon]
MSTTEDSLNAFVTQCDLDSGEGPLDDLTVGVKDNISTEGIETTCGSRVLEGYVPPYDATAVARLKDAGARIVGKTNMDEFGMGTTTETSAHGPTRNPVDTDYVPGGSSGGSAAAVAAGEVDAALGTDTGGSVRCPAAFCGIVGLKPTYGLVSRYGLIAYANSLETIGPMARDVETTARVLEAMAGADERDGTCSAEAEDYTTAVEDAEGALEGATVAVPEELVGEGVEEGVRERFDDALETLRDEGAKVREVSMPSLEKALAAYYVIAMGEASSNLARFDGVRYGPGGKGDGWNEAFADARGRFGDEVKRRIMLGTYALSEGYYGDYYDKAQNARALVRRDFEEVLDEADVVASPTMPLTPFRLGEALDDPLQMYLADVNTTPVNLAGVPSISVPCGRADGLPVGLQLTAGRFEEKKLLSVARAFEKAR